VLASLLLFASFLHAAPIRLALIEETSPLIGLGAPLQPEGATLIDSLTLPCYHANGDFRWRLPAGTPLSEKALLVETAGAWLIVSPPEPEALAGLGAGQSSRPVRLSIVEGVQGERLVSLLSGDSESASWDSTMLSHYRYARPGKEDLSVSVIGKVRGGFPRLAAALEKERAKGPVIGVARGGVFNGMGLELRGSLLTEALDAQGLDYAGVDERALRRLGVLDEFQKRKPGAVTFLSANLVYSTAPAVTVFPAYAETGGVFLTAVTPPRAARHLPHLKVLDPLEAVETVVKKAKGALVVVLARDELAAKLKKARGVDVVLGENQDEPPETRVEGTRGLPLLVMRASPVTLNLLEAELSGKTLRLTERHLPLDDGPSGFDPDSYGVAFSTEPPLIPAWRSFSSSKLDGAQFWRMSASLLAEDYKAEAGVLSLLNLPATTDGPVTESMARAWLRSDDDLVVAEIPGSRLQALLSESDLAAGGIDEGRVHGLPIDASAPYRVVMTRALADTLGAPAAAPLGRLDDLALAALRRRAGSAPRSYRRWIEGKPTATSGLWRLNFRDVGVNLRNTDVRRDEAFAPVPNSRLQGFNERLIGYVGKVDAEYLRETLKWTNTAEAEYARSRITPRTGPPITNTTANRLLLRTMATRRAGGIGPDWLARSYGPSIGLQYDGEFESAAGARRKKVYSAFPGVEFYDGTIVRSLELAGNFKRDLSREPPNTQYGFRFRALASLPVKAAVLEAETFTNYFFLTKRDLPQDLRVEGNAIVRLRVPVWRHFSVAPFFDIYYAQLKTRPVWAYSAMTGITIGFSRLWKPRYERF
jgi:hypothetical protein